ncbi:MAG: histidine phosphatase family protein [Actinomycetota bacterium]|nr:histidine phosphatase family protein [Actinomycetota bacterium]
MTRGRLVLMRHAKSAYPTGVPDHDRPLNERGQSDVIAAHKWCSEFGSQLLGPRPAIVVSTALRTQQTWQGLASAFPDAHVQHSSRVYEAVVSTLIDLCAEQLAAGLSTMVIGHNPGVESMADFLALPGASAPAWVSREKFPTSAIAVLELTDDSWSRHSAVVSTFVVPRG